MPRELVSCTFGHVLDDLWIREDLPLDQPDVFVRSLLEVPRVSTIDHWFFIACRDAFSSNYHAMIEIDVSNKHPN